MDFVMPNIISELEEQERKRKKMLADFAKRTEETGEKLRKQVEDDVGRSYV